MVSLSLILFDMIRNGALTSKPKRCQMGIMTGKLIFFFSLCAGTLLRNPDVACKLTAVHYAMLVSCSYVIWYGVQVRLKRCAMIR